MQKESGNQLLRRVDELSMMMVDLNLYLDTHPYDEEAIDAFNKYQEMLRMAKKEYEQQYGPLTASSARPEHKWEWALTPWPWQKECD